MFTNTYGELFDYCLYADATAMTQEELCDLQPRITDRAKSLLKAKIENNMYIKNSINQIEYCLSTNPSTCHKMNLYWGDEYIKAVVC